MSDQRSAERDDIRIEDTTPTTTSSPAQEDGTSIEDQLEDTPIEERLDGTPTEEQSLSGIAEEVAHLTTELEITTLTNDPYRSLNAAECREIIAATTFERHNINNASKNQHDVYAARCIPNQRIAAAFGVSNSFTTNDRAESQKFRNEVAVPRIEFDMEKWKTIVREAHQLVRYKFSSTALELSLWDVVQTVVMKSAASVLFDDFDIRDHNMNEHAKSLAKKINTQWIRSKEADFLDRQTSDSFLMQTELRDALKAMFPNRNIDNPDENPLNLILPGYETLWRIVVRGVIELAARSHNQADEWKEVLGKFSTNPTKHPLYNNDVNGSGVSAASIVKEALRLYPPTKRVQRAYKTEDGKEFLATADIEKSHRDPEVWGEDALSFKPERWNDLTAAFERDNFMAFGGKPFVCPAGRKKFPNAPDRSPFGITFIAVLMDALLGEMGEKWKIQGAEATELLSLDREAYEELRLVQQEEGDIGPGERGCKCV